MGPERRPWLLESGFFFHATTEKRRQLVNFTLCQQTIPIFTRLPASPWPAVPRPPQPPQPRLRGLLRARPGRALPMGARPRGGDGAAGASLRGHGGAAAAAATSGEFPEARRAGPGPAFLILRPLLRPPLPETLRRESEGAVPAVMEARYNLKSPGRRHGRPRRAPGRRPAASPAGLGRAWGGGAGRRGVGGRGRALLAARAAAFGALCSPRGCRGSRRSGGPLPGRWRRGRRSPAGARRDRCSGRGQAAVGRREGWGPRAAAVPAGAGQLRAGEVAAFRRRPAGWLLLPSAVALKTGSELCFGSKQAGYRVCVCPRPPTRFCWSVEAYL